LNYFFAEWLKVGSNCILNKSNIFEDFLTKTFGDFIYIYIYIYTDVYKTSLNLL
jgi:hypothetical protein